MLEVLFTFLVLGWLGKALFKTSLWIVGTIIDLFPYVAVFVFFGLLYMNPFYLLQLLLILGSVGGLGYLAFRYYKKLQGENKND